uniref:Ryanodine receptor junctional solenoid domain-containing protein n=1 Tax=Romanomermis culicivorax TaxID=13658 RepID=A0A915IF17_ROMCU
METTLKPPKFNFVRLKSSLMECLTDATYRAVTNCRDLIGGDTFYHFQPLLKLFNKLLIIGSLNDDDLRHFLALLDPVTFSCKQNTVMSNCHKGLMQLQLDEAVKCQLCCVLNHLCDVELRHRIESIVAFAEGFVGEAQRDQLRRYIDVKQSDMGPAEAARKTKEFRCPPKDQMLRWLGYYDKDNAVMDEEGEIEECPMSEHLQNNLRLFHETLVKKLSNKPAENQESAGFTFVDDENWVDKLATILVRVPQMPLNSNKEKQITGTIAFRKMIISSLARWARESFIESTELVRSLFALLLRQYNGVSEIIDGLGNTYVIHDRNTKDVETFFVYLSHVRTLLSVQFEWVEEEIVKKCL